MGFIGAWVARKARHVSGWADAKADRAVDGLWGPGRDKPGWEPASLESIAQVGGKAPEASQRALPAAAVRGPGFAAEPGYAARDARDDGARAGRRATGWGSGGVAHHATFNFNVQQGQAVAIADVVNIGARTAFRPGTNQS
ncbi:hypothetical protein ABT104_09590 [Streptomyces mobaraensis]|uniref:hypothetical protein n=1 Tax=Streptomyces mobaraensis TaxID=35621 RepID=UPI003326AA91